MDAGHTAGADPVRCRSQHQSVRMPPALLKKMSMSLAGFAIGVEVVVDGVVDESAHHVVDGAAQARQVDRRIADGLVDQRQVGGIAGVACAIRVLYWLGRVCGAVAVERYGQCLPDYRRRLRRQVVTVISAAADRAAIVVGLDHGGIAHHGCSGQVRYGCARR